MARCPADPLTTSNFVYESRNRAVIETLDSIEQRQLSRVRSHIVFCNRDVPGRRITHFDSENFYRDDDHLSKAGVNLVAQVMARAIEEPEFVEGRLSVG